MDYSVRVDPQLRKQPPDYELMLRLLEEDLLSSLIHHHLRLLKLARKVAECGMRL